jgi:hypothetical protein
MVKLPRVLSGYLCVPEIGQQSGFFAARRKTEKICWKRFLQCCPEILGRLNGVTDKFKNHLEM